MQGLWIGGRRPRSNREVKEALARDPRSVRVEATSVHGREYDGPASDMPAGLRIAFVGPDPYRERRFYGTLSKSADGTLRVA